MRQLPRRGRFMGGEGQCAFQEKVQLTEKQKKAPPSGELSMPEGID